MNDLRKQLVAAVSLALSLGGCVAESDKNEADQQNQTSTVTVSQAQPANIGLVAAQLKAESLDLIEVGDGITPVVSGSWIRLTPETSWTWQLLGEMNLGYDVDVYVVDLFAQFDSDVIERLHAQNKTVICYFSVGTYEPWRPDAEFFNGVPIGNPHVAYPNEKWIDIKSIRAKKIMANRMDMAVGLGCDGVELDNVDGFVADTGFDITMQQQLEYQRILANEAHKRNLAVAIKNSVETIPQVVDYFDFVINEECFEYNECEGYLPMVAAGKPMFNAEYSQLHIDDPVAREEICVRARQMNIRTLWMPLALDGSFRLSCD